MMKLCKMAGKAASGLAVAGMVAATLAGCATPPTDPAARAEFEQINDPMEPANRYFFELNRFLDFLLIHPWADTYHRIVPDFGRARVHNVLANAGAPMDAINQALQGRGTDSATTLGRLVVNSTVGLGGMFDVAGKIGLPATGADFGQTLHVWGMPEGPYLVLPVLGPSNPRDAVGFGVDTAADPVGWAFSLNHLGYINNQFMLAGAIDQRSEVLEPMEALEKSSIDFYAQVRSMARQHRAKELGIQPTSSTSYPNYDFYDEPVAPAPKKTP